MTPFVVITGGGGGIGRSLVQRLHQRFQILTCGRRAAALEQTRQACADPSRVITVACDIGEKEGRQSFFSALPPDAAVAALVQNAAIGDPEDFEDLSVEHFEHALRVNVVAPVALTKLFLPALQRHRGGRVSGPGQVSGPGRILHLGTSVAFQPQRGTLTYGVTKAAFHRLYEQLNAEQLGGVPCGSLSPGTVDTEGVRDHVAKARALDLPHTKFFDEAYEKRWLTPEERLMDFAEELLFSMPADEFASREWRFRQDSEQVNEQYAEARRRAGYGGGGSGGGGEETSRTSKL